MRLTRRTLGKFKSRKLNMEQDEEWITGPPSRLHWGHSGEEEAKGDIHQDGQDIWLYDECITHDTAMKFQVALQEAVLEAKMIAMTYKVIPPIRLHIHSNGGDLFSGFGIADAVANCKIPVHTYIEGLAASAASLIAVCGAKRFITPSSHVLIHQLSAGFAGTHEDFQEELKNQEILMDRLRAIYLERSSMSEDEIEALLKTDQMLSAQDCLKRGIVDLVGTDLNDSVGL